MSDHKHHILPEKTAWTIFVALLIGTVITVFAAQFDLGVLNFPVAMLIATSKALLVVLWFMGLLYDGNDNRIIFGTSFIFCVIFVVLTSADIFFRDDDVYVEEIGNAFPVEGAPKIKYAKFWEGRDELVNHGKTLYTAQCASCHGDSGAGDGPAAAGLNPKPRNFAEGSGWKNGRKPTEIYGTLSNGLGSMPVFSNLPPDDRFALAHYVRTFGSGAPADTAGDLKNAGIDVSKDDGGLGSAAPKTLPVDFAIELVAEEARR